MAARRKKRGRRRNRGRFGFLYKLLSALLICAAIVVGCIVFFRVNTIAITGVSRYTEQEIIAASGVKQGDNLFRLDKFGIAKKILTKLPYVDEISISRKLPDTLVLQVTESRPVAYLTYGGENWLISAKGKLLERGDAAQVQGLAQITGLVPLAPALGGKLAVDQSQQKRLDSLVSLLSALQAEHGMTGSLSGFIDLTAENKIRFGYGAQLTVVMPMNGDFAAQAFALRRTLETMDERLVAREGTLDLTYEGGKAHLLPERWLPGQAEPDGTAGEDTKKQGEAETNGTEDGAADEQGQKAAE